MTAFEECHLCGGRRHRDLQTGVIQCLTCDRRREHERSMAASKRALLAKYPVTTISLSYETYRDHEIRLVDGQGWRWREIGSINGWLKAHSRADAYARIDRLRQGDPRQMGDHGGPFEKCRFCGDPANGTTNVCKSCAIEKFRDSHEPRGR